MASAQLEREVSEYLAAHPDAKRLELAQAIGRAPGTVSDTIAWSQRKVNHGPGPRRGEWTKHEGETVRVESRPQAVEPITRHVQPVTQESLKEHLHRIADEKRNIREQLWHRGREGATHRVSEYSDVCILTTSADHHKGAGGCDSGRFDHLCDVMDAEPRVKLNSGGDMIENAAVSEKMADAQVEQTMTQQEQVEWLIDRVERYVSPATPDRDQWWWMHLGNHEIRWQKATGFDLIGWLADRSGVRVMPYGPVTLTIDVGVHTYRGVFKHKIRPRKDNPTGGVAAMIANQIIRERLDWAGGAHIHKPGTSTWMGMFLFVTGTDNYLHTAYGEEFGSDAYVSYPTMVMHGAPGERRLKGFDSLRDALAYCHSYGIKLSIDWREVHV